MRRAEGAKACWILALVPSYVSPSVRNHHARIVVSADSSPSVGRGSHEPLGMHVLAESYTTAVTLEKNLAHGAQTVMRSHHTTISKPEAGYNGCYTRGPKHDTEELKTK